MGSSAPILSERISSVANHMQQDSNSQPHIGNAPDNVDLDAALHDAVGRKSSSVARR